MKTLLLTLLTSLFYAISTNVISETDSLGNEVYNAALTPAELVYQSDTITITLDCVAHVLVADVEAERYYNEAFRPWYNPGCLHTQDLLFYLPYIRKNILLHF